MATSEAAEHPPMRVTRFAGAFGLPKLPKLGWDVVEAHRPALPHSSARMVGHASLAAVLWRSWSRSRYLRRSTNVSRASSRFDSPDISVPNTSATSP